MINSINNSKAELNFPKREGWGLIGEHPGDSSIPLVGNEQNGEQMFLTGREFCEVDEHVSHRFVALIVKKIKENPDRKIVVLDVGGGVESRALAGILQNPYFKGKVKCINVDLFAAPTMEVNENGTCEEMDDLQILNENMAECSLPDNSIDAVISFQALNYMCDEDFQKTLVQVSRILAPGGEAYMDVYGNIDRGGREREAFRFPELAGFNDPSWRNVIMKNGVMMMSTMMEQKLDGSMHTIGSFGTPMLFMGKMEGNYNYPQMDSFYEVRKEIGEAIREIREQFKLTI